jgi:phosphoglycolate phosphatase-like HAD superfamily hydrolase
VDGSPELAHRRERRAQAGLAEHFNGRDLYPDVRRCFTALKRAGYFIGIAGNQTARAGRLLQELNLGADLIATSEDWGAKNQPQRSSPRSSTQPGFDRTTSPTLVTGSTMTSSLPCTLALVTVFIRRGPWGYFHARQPEADQAHLQIDSLDDLVTNLPPVSCMPPRCDT